jgi:hypothetical protein
MKYPYSYISRHWAGTINVSSHWHLWTNMYMWLFFSRHNNNGNSVHLTVNIIQSTNQSTQTVVLFYSKSVLILEIKSKSENFNIGVRNSYSTALWLCALSNSWWMYCMGVSMVFLYLIVSTVLCLSNSPFSRIQCTPLDFSTLLRYVSLLFSGWFQLCILMSCHDLQNFTMDNTAGFW